MESWESMIFRETRGGRVVLVECVKKRKDTGEKKIDLPP